MHQQADDGTRAAKVRCRRKAADRRSCVAEYLARKALSANGTIHGGARRCQEPTDAMSDASRAEMARCLRTGAAPSVGPALSISTLVHKHLWTPANDTPLDCLPLASAPPSGSARCVRSAGAATWSAAGLSSENATAACGRRWQGTAAARCLFAGRDVLAIGNSVMRRQVFTLLDVLAGPEAHRLLADGTTVSVSPEGGEPRLTPRALMESTRLWDRDGHENGYHAAQLITIDLATGAHRFHLPHVELCGVDTPYANFNAGRSRQWFSPSANQLGEAWRSMPAIEFHPQSLRASALPCSACMRSLLACRASVLACRASEPQCLP